MNHKSLGFIQFNSPVILGMTTISFGLLLVGMATGGRSDLFLSLHYTSFLDPRFYLGIVGYSLVHYDWAHFISNYLLLLAVGPLVEEKYGSRMLLGMMTATALISAVAHLIVLPGTRLMGASGLVFMVVLLASFANFKNGKIPLTLILMAILRIGSELFTGITTVDNISHFGHILGGVCGIVFGFLFHWSKEGPKADNSGWEV